MVPLKPECCELPPVGAATISVRVTGYMVRLSDLQNIAPKVHAPTPPGGRRSGTQHSVSGNASRA
ncbi:hypothetical protein ACLK1S_27300 [Escherichia coli]